VVVLVEVVEVVVPVEVVVGEQVVVDVLEVGGWLLQAGEWVLVVLVELVVGQYYVCSPFCVKHEQHDDELDTQCTLLCTMLHMLYFAGCKFFHFQSICQQSKSFRKSKILLCANPLVKIIAFDACNLLHVDMS
jgi:hypothetical protein